MRRYNVRWIDVTLLINYYSDIYYHSTNSLQTGDYWTMDIALSRTRFNHITLFVNAENIFN